MGNSHAKESGASDNAYAGRRRSVAAYPHNAEHDADRHSSRNNRVSRGDLNFLGLAGASNTRDRNRNREDAPFEHKETRAEREARRLERERALRLKERERSLKEEHIDGGYLVTLGVYTGPEDFNKQVVRQLQVSRPPFPDGSCPSIHNPLLSDYSHLCRLRESSLRSGVVSMTGPKTGLNTSSSLLPAACPSPLPTRRLIRISFRDPYPRKARAPRICKG